MSENTKQVMREDRAARDRVNHPAHYGGGDNPYEHVKVAEALGWTGNAFIYNATKYLWRWRVVAGLEDLRKARWYLDRLISNLERVDPTTVFPETDTQTALRRTAEAAASMRAVAERREATCEELGCHVEEGRHSVYCTQRARG